MAGFRLLAKARVALQRQPIGIRWMVTLWLVLGLALSAKSLIKPGSHSVFPVYHFAATNWFHDAPLYERHPSLDYFRYPPVAALLFSPFAILGVTWGAILWGGFALGVYAWACHKLFRSLLGDRDENGWGYLALGSIALLCALPGIWNHQSNAFLGALLILGWINIRHHRPLVGGYSFALAVVLKPTVLPSLVLLALAPGRRWVLHTLLGVAMAFAFPLLVKSPEMVWAQHQDWWEHIRDTHGERWPGFRDAWFAWLVVLEQAQGDAVWPYFWDVNPNLVYRSIQVASGMVCFVAVLLWRWRGMPPEQAAFRALALGLCWLMLFGPATEFPTLGMVAPFLAWGCFLAWSTPGRWWMVAAVALIGIFGWRAVTLPLVPHLPLVLLAIPLGLTLFTLWLVQDSSALIQQRNDLFTKPAALDPELNRSPIEDAARAA